MIDDYSCTLSQNDLEYDPALYQRDRGEADWDARSIASSTYFGDNASVYNLKQGGRDSPAPGPLGYSEYIANGPRNVPNDHIEMTRIQTRDDQAPLLTHQHNFSSPQISRNPSAWSGGGAYSPSEGIAYPPRPYPNDQIPPNYLQSPPQMRRGISGDDQAYREAPLHRYQASQGSGSGNFAGVGTGFR